MIERTEAVVVGAGVLGLAVARRLALDGREVVVVERWATIGSETSSRNSEVVHAGIYYPPGSLKARACVEGKARLYRYLAERGVAHRRPGKLIVATAEGQIPKLEAIEARARANGVGDLCWLDGQEARALEPELACVAALLSPSTGILDSHGYMLALEGDAEAHGAAFAFLTPVERIHAEEAGFAVETGGRDPLRLGAKLLVNAAGLHAPWLAGRIEGFPSEHLPRGYFCKGSYYTLQGVKPPFSRLVYPAPEEAGLGIHATLDLAGRCRFGPDVEWIEELDYDVNPARAERFYAAIRAYWPALPDGALHPGYAGIRPKLQAPGEPPRDFLVQGEAEHGLPGLVNLFGIESPGLTASLALADLVAERLG